MKRLYLDMQKVVQYIVRKSEGGCAVDSTTYSDFRKNLKRFMEQVHDRRAPMVITRKDGKDMVMMPLRDYQAIEETFYLLKSQANAEHLMASLEESEKGHAKEVPLSLFED